MKKLPITKEAFEKSKYFTNKYGKLEYISESGKLFKTNKGKILMFKEYVDSGAPLPKRRSDGACDKLKPGEYGLSKEWVEGIGTRYVIYKGGIKPGQMFSIKTFGARQKDRAEEVLMGLQDGSIQEKNLSYVHETSKGKLLKFKESYDPTLDSAWDEYDEEIPKYLKELDEELYMACTMTDEYRGKHFSTGERELNYDFLSAEDKALHAVVKEIEAEVGEKIDLVDFVMKYIPGKELAHRVVDYILERKPGKALAKKLAKIGY